MSTFLSEKTRARLHQDHERITGWPWRDIEIADPVARNDAREDESSIGISINKYVATLPVRRDGGASAGGLVLLLPRSGLTVVPSQWRDEYLGHSWWSVTVVAGSSTYKVGGYDLCVGTEEIAAAIEVSLPEVPAPAEDALVRRYAASCGGRILKLSSGAVVLVMWPRSTYDYPGLKAAVECVVLDGVGTQRRGSRIAVPYPQIETAHLIEV